MPSALRSRLAVLGLVAAFLIPVGTSSLRGLTHVLTCRDEAEVPFTLVTPPRGNPVIVSSTVIERDQPEGVCGGLLLDIAVGPGGPGRVSLRVAVENRSEFDWQGTVRLRLGSTTVPVDIGEIRNGSTAEDTLTVRVRPGQTELQGSMLIGP